MSWWTYITGSIRVSVPGRSQPEVQYILDTVLDHLPHVTGSEQDMHVHAIREDGYSSFSSVDEYGMRTDNLIDTYGDRSRNGWLRVQDNYIIVLSAHLRDRELRETKEEFMRWLTRLAKRLLIDDVFVRIWDYDGEFVINEREKFSRMHEDPSWCRSKYSTGEPSWWEHLMWEEDPRSLMPLTHVYKYFESKAVEAEIDRREKWRDTLA